MLTGVQQIMIGSAAKSEDEAAAVLGRIRAAGFDGIELNSFMIHPTSLMVRLMTKAAGMPVGKGGSFDWKRLVSDAGLCVISLHSDLGSIKRDPAAVAAEAKAFGTDRVVITGMYRFNYGDDAAVRSLCADLNAAGEQLLDLGIRLHYHNHNVEFNRLSDGALAYDRIIDGTDPEKVFFEMDSFWMADAGADPLAYMKKLGSRMKLYHITDRGFRSSGPSMTPIVPFDSVELGTGAMNLPALLAQAEENGTEAVVLETHKNWIDKDPVKSLEVSGRWLKENRAER